MRRKENLGTVNAIEMPTGLSPMLCTLVKAPFDDPSFLFEVKWDGYRLSAYKYQRSIKLLSRGGHDYTKRYPPIAQAIQSLDADIIVDGEAIVLNNQGKPDFDALQKFNGQHSGVLYYAFDILWLNGQNLMNLPLIKRKEILSNLVKDNEVIKYSEHFDSGRLLFDQVNKIGLEGIVAKRRTSVYTPGKRSKDWLKIPTEKRQEFVIGGWIESEKRNGFRTLLFGSYERGRLKWKGHAGGGYKEKDIPIILKRLKAIEIDKNPFDSALDYSEGRPHWVKPELVANIKFATTTKAGKIRKPAVFLGFREDKDASDVITEEAIDSPRPTTHSKPASRIGRAKKNIAHPVGLSINADSNWPEIESEVIRNKDLFRIGDCEITLHNVDKELWKGVTKADLIKYYNSVSRFILPHIKNRPLFLHVKTKGPNAPGLYIKDMEGRQPNCADVYTTTRRHKKAGKRDKIDYLVCNNPATLLYMIDLGCIDINPWTSTLKSPLHPDFIVIDLDPSDGDFGKAIETAQCAWDFFKSLRLVGFAKTSGKTGMHLLLPCNSITFPQARKIAETICAEIQKRLPDTTTTTITVSDRGSKLYLDPNQNDYSDTLAAPYSARPFKLPLVSTPLEWTEVTHSLAPDIFTIKTIGRRLQQKDDVFAGVLDETIARANTKILQTLL
jgi:bifunctional non-homologous end joining protein LigD